MGRVSKELDVEGRPASLDAEFGGSETRLELERKLLRKLDIRMSILILIYILTIVDRNNVSVARIKGFEADLHLEGQQFNTVLGIFYVGKILMQIPSNLFLNYIGRPSIYLPTCMVLWGALSCLTGTTQSFMGALLTRFFLGFVEAIFIPGALFLLSKWYKRSELGLRTALLSCGLVISNSFGSLMASGILSGMQGKLGHAAWRWLFYIEGALTMLVVVIAIFVLPDFPENSHDFLSPEEIQLAKLRMQEDVGVNEEIERKDSRFPGLYEALGDWHVYWLALALTSLMISLSFNAFFPTLTKTLGYSPTITLLLCAPPWGFAAIVAFAVSWHSDKTGERTFHIVIPLFIGIIGFVIAISTMRLAARYVALYVPYSTIPFGRHSIVFSFLMAQSYAGFICFVTWSSNTFARSPSKCAVALAFTNAFSQLGNTAGSYMWQKSWGPTYIRSYAICISTNGLCIVMCLIFRQVLAKQNKHLEERESSEAMPRGYRYLL
ncbi:MFS general substrate transporter [Lactifluus subvellereus]|nr:MFS general substrate transporter [Lactifluus subvellereus]